MKEITLTIESLASTGLGVGRIQEGKFTRAVFVPFTCPGDSVKVKIIEQKKKYYMGELVKVITPSLSRVPIRCKHFGVCGSCDLLHIHYDKEVEMKKAFLQYMFKEFYSGDISVLSGSPDFYRQKIRVHAENGKVGWKKYRSNDLINVEECYLIHQPLLPEMRTLQKEEGEFYLVDRGDSVVIADSSDEITLEDVKKKKVPICSYVLNGQNILFAPSCFIQNNAEVNEKTVNVVARIFEAEKPTTALELFSGIGNFSSHIKNCRMTCVEGDEMSSYFATMNAPTHHHVHEEVYEFLEKNKKTYDIVLLDPPREGLREGFEEKIASITDTIVFISCNPSVLKESLKKMKEFEVKQMIFADMFPRTHHVEIVVLLRKNA